jgi:DNA-binding protein HU-beta
MSFTSSDRHARFGSNCDLNTRSGHVRCTPESGNHGGHSARSKNRKLDDLTYRSSSRWFLHSGRRSVLNPTTLIKGTTMPKMTKSQLIDAISESSAVSKKDVKAVIEDMATVGYKELNESGEFVIPGFVKMSVVNKPATEARSGVNPFTKEPMEFAAKPASKTVKASPLKVAKDAV